MLIFPSRGATSSNSGCSSRTMDTGLKERRVMKVPWLLGTPAAASRSTRMFSSSSGTLCGTGCLRTSATRWTPTIRIGQSLGYPSLPGKRGSGQARRTSTACPASSRGGTPIKHIWLPILQLPRQKQRLPNPWTGCPQLTFPLPRRQICLPRWQTHRFRHRHHQLPPLWWEPARRMPVSMPQLEQVRS